MFKILKSNLLKEECRLGWGEAHSSEGGGEGMGDGEEEAAAFSAKVSSGPCPPPCSVPAPSQNLDSL